MLKKVVSVAVAMVLSAPLYASDDMEKRVNGSRKVIKEFAGTLKGEMQGAMKSGGPTEAIKVCNLRANQIAAEYMSKTDWDVGRTSLKLRNTLNEPDAWEEAVLMKFEERKKAGEDVKKLDHYEVVEKEGKKFFRYMKAIPTGKVCLTCHGSDLDVTVKMRLSTFYPEDKARGFKEGDIRGAFTITQPMD